MAFRFVREDEGGSGEFEVRWPSYEEEYGEETGEAMDKDEVEDE